MERISKPRLQSLNLILGEAVKDLLHMRIAENGERHLEKCNRKIAELVNELRSNSVHLHGLSSYVGTS